MAQISQKQLVKIDRLRFLAVPAVQLLGNTVFMNSAEPVLRLNCDERKASLGECQSTFVCSTTSSPNLGFAISISLSASTRCGCSALHL
jgi:hypothetical protein